MSSNTISVLNSYDYRKTKKGQTYSLPFIGSYEVVDNLLNISIFVKTAGNDILYVDFNNVYTTDDTYSLRETYPINNTQRSIVITPKMKYFRIKITTASFSSSDVRIYNTFLLNQQPMLTDASGRLLTAVEGINIGDITISGVILSHSTSDILVYGNDGTTDRKVKLDSNGKIILSDASYNSIIYGNDGTTNRQLRVDASGKIILADASYNSIIYGNYNNTNKQVAVDSSGQIIISNNSSSITTKFPAVNLDAFGRLRISNPYTLFDSKNVEQKNQKFTEYTASISDNIVFDISNSVLNLNCAKNGATNGRIVRESKTVFAYQPGKSLLVLLTFVMDTGASGLVQRVGYYDDNDGIYLEYNNTTLTLNIRSTSHALQTVTYNVDWDYSFPGLNVTKSQIFWMDIEWLGVGNVRTGFVINGEFIVCHTFEHANIITSTYMKTAQLPIRYEITNTSTTSKTLKQICSTVISEGGYEGLSIIRHIGTLENTISNGIEIPASNNVTYKLLVAIRLKNTRLKTIIIPSQLSILVNGNSVYKILVNPTTSTLSWTSYSSDSAIEYVISTTASPLDASGGTQVNSGFITSKDTISLSSSRDFNLQLGRNFNGATNTYTSDILVVAAAGLGSNTRAYGMVGWYEL